jgi:exopolyphosphatase/pppGpp-phosphohydrolase
MICQRSERGLNLKVHWQNAMYAISGSLENLSGLHMVMSIVKIVGPKQIIQHIAEH